MVGGLIREKEIGMKKVGVVSVEDGLEEFWGNFRGGRRWVGVLGERNGVVGDGDVV